MRTEEEIKKELENARKLFDKETTYERLEEDFSGMSGKALKYKDIILAAGYYNAPDGFGYYAAAYYYKDENDHAADAPAVLHTISDRTFEDDGQAIEWALHHAFWKNA